MSENIDMDSVNPNCSLIAVTGGKGGLGKSVFAANLALTFLKELRAQTLLLDLDEKSCGDQNILLGLRPKKTLSELSASASPINSSSLAQIVTQHKSGLSYIGAVTSPNQEIQVSKEIFARQLSSLSSFYKYIIVDLGTAMEEAQLFVVQEAQAIMVVTIPEILALTQTSKLLSRLSAEGVPGPFLQIVLNKSSPNVLSPQFVQQNLKLSLIGSLPLDDITSYRALQSSTPFVLSGTPSQLASSYHELVRRLTGGVLQKLKSLSHSTTKKDTSSSSKTPALGQKQDSEKGKSSHKQMINSIKLQIHSELIKEMDVKKDMTQIKGDEKKEKELKNKTQKEVSQITDRLAQNLSRQERSEVIKQVLDEALGLGPLEELLSDPQVTEIMVNGHENIYMEKSGKLQLSPITFTSNLQLRNVIERIVTPLGRRIDEKTPYVDARLRDGSRVNAVIEPLAIDGPSVTIRKFPQEKVTIDHLVKRFESITSSMANFLRICVEQGLNVIVSGGTGSGKTTLLNVLSSFIPSNERIITVEDAAELQLNQEHVVRLETRPSNIEGEGEVSIRDLIRNTLRMRPDRIVVGECRDGAALDMLSAMNTGHDGSMTTVHANNPREAISRLETLCLMAGMEIPAKALREQIASAVHLIVQIGRLSDGSRKVLYLTEVVGMQGETVTLQDIFRFKEEGFDKNRKIIGRFQSMGLIPTFIEKFEQRGISIPRDLFTGEDKKKSEQKVPPSTSKSSGLSGKMSPRPPLKKPIFKKSK